MQNTTTELPVHPVTGLTALGWRRTGAPIWPVLGGDGTTPPADGGDAGDPGGDGAPGGEPGDGSTDPDGDAGGGDGDGGDPDGAGELGDAGKKALAAQKAKWKSERQKRQDAERRLAELEAAAKKGGEDDPEEIRRKAQAEVLSKANERIVSAEVRAAAAQKLADPADAVHFLDLSKFEVDEQGDVDKEEISEAIEDLLQRKPYLAAGATRRFQGGGDGGQGRGSKQPSLDQQIREAEKAGDTMRAIALKSQKLKQASK